MSWHETCACKYRLDACFCNEKRRWKSDKCRCGCRELIDKSRCDNGFNWNPSVCEGECDESCDVGQYFNYVNCKCRKRFIVKLVLECKDVILNITKSILIADKKLTCNKIIVLFTLFHW